MKWNSVTKPFKKLLVSHGGSTAGRNSAGRITIFHRGGGAKRLQRKVDLKRSTSSMGVVERIEYDPNRSSRVALVRWIEGVQPSNRRDGEKDFNAPQKTVDPITATIAGQFSLGCLAAGIVAGNPLHKEGSKLNSVKDVFVSAFGSQKAKNVSLSKLPRIAVSGARPAVFVPQRVEQAVEGENTLSLSDLQRWNKDSVLWEHKLKSKAAVSWSSFVKEEPVGLAQAALNRDANSVQKSSKKKAEMVDRAALTYILASNEMEPGKMVMNCDLPKRSKNN
ncbi:hypothetical protein KSS87_019118 [Heliosperma pusillum]|nr:hypothetical protein KSS87_004815 [Heliosperma pusillum]KAH9624049.1 hypothetical protein KSS87_019118 [Heliosperma pusillum]